MIIIAFCMNYRDMYNMTIKQNSIQNCLDSRQDNVEMAKTLENHLLHVQKLLKPTLVCRLFRIG